MVETIQEGAASGAHKVNWWILISVGCGTFMSALDGSVVNTILPVLTRSLHSTAAMVEWVVTAYLLITTGLLLTAGKWGDVNGHKRLYLTGYTIFIGGSALCGLSKSVEYLIAFRCIQAIGATMLFATSPAIVTINFPAERRGQALGIQGAMTYLGIATGPLLGGYLAARFGWQSVFYINVPVGLVAFALSAVNIPNSPPRDGSAKFDLLGATLFFAGLTALLLPLDQAHAWGWLSLRTIGLLCLAFLMLLGFVRVEHAAQSPMIDLKLFANRTFSASTISSVLNFMTMSSVLFLIPYYLITGRGFTPDHAGELLVALPIPMVLVAPLSGFLSDRVGTRLPAIVGMSLMTIGCVLLTRLSLHSSMPYLCAGLGIVGVGTGIFISPNNSALMGAVSRDDQGVASGVRATARNVGNVIGVGMAGAIFNAMLAHIGQGLEHTAVVYGVEAGILATVITALLGTVASAMQNPDPTPRRSA